MPQDGHRRAREARPQAPADAGTLMSVADVEAVARAAHAGQTDKAGRPYAEHLAAVAEGVRARGGGDELVAAAWLHDAVEDGVLDEEWLEAAALPQRTKDVVRAVTKRPGEEPEAYARRILATPGARLVKAADLAHNADPRRLAVLDAPTARRLAAKYAAMRRHLGLTADDRPATTDQPRPTTGERPPATDHRQAAADEPALTTDQ